MNSSVQLVLKTTDISTSNTGTDYYGNTVSSAIGQVSQNRTSMTWYNINMRALLGDIFDKYERFNISLNFVAGSATNISTETNLDYRLFQVKMKGLPFITSFSPSSTTSTGQVCFNVINIPATAATPWVNNYFTQQYYTFTKQDMVNITIDLHTVLGDTYYVPTANTKMIGHCIFSFNIYGIDDFKHAHSVDKIDITTNRMNIGKLENKNKISM